jgi:hypothetical protein
MKPPDERNVMGLKKILVRPEPYKNANWFDSMARTMDKEDFTYLLDCLKDPAFSNAYLANKLTEAGYPVSRTTIADVRRRKIRG